MTIMHAAHTHVACSTHTCSMLEHTRGQHTDVQHAAHTRVKWSTHVPSLTSGVGSRALAAVRFMDLEPDEVESMEAVARGNGGTFFMPGFFSTSKREAGTEDFNLKNTKIYVEIPPSYTWALEVTPEMSKWDEEEVLLTCWTQFQLISVTPPPAPGEKREIRLRAIAVDGGVGRGVQTGVKSLGPGTPRRDLGTDLSARDEELVQQLMGLGLDREMTVQAYVDSGKDFNLAANYLVDQGSR